MTYVVFGVKSTLGLVVPGAVGKTQESFVLEMDGGADAAGRWR